jgi:flagellar biosynthesis regulator FlbT
VFGTGTGKSRRPRAVGDFTDRESTQSKGDRQMAQSSQTDQILSSLAQIESTLNSGRLFDVLEVVRDQVRDLKNQNQQIRNDLMDLQRTVFEVNAGGGKAAD